MDTRYKDRTDQKLRYANIHISDLAAYKNLFSNDEWENSHQESVFYHLAGSVESFLHEINDKYKLGLSMREVTWKSVENKLVKNVGSSPAFDLLFSLRDDSTSWLSLLFEWRNHGTHRGRVSKIVRLSNNRKIGNEFKDPRTDKPQTVFPNMACFDLLKQLSTETDKLIQNCRTIDPKLNY